MYEKQKDTCNTHYLIELRVFPLKPEIYHPLPSPLQEQVS